MKIQNKKNEDGFTLVEILVVLVILAILAAVSIPTMRGFIDDAKRKTYLVEARSVYVACQAAATELSGGTADIDEESVVKIANELLADDISGDYSLILDSSENWKVKSITYTSLDGTSISINSDGEITYGGK